MKKSKELEEKSAILNRLISDTYFELIKDRKEYSFIRKVLDDEDINDPSEEAMWLEIQERGLDCELPTIELRDGFTGDMYDVYVLSVDATGITFLPVQYEDVDEIECGGRFSEVATTWSKIYLIEKMEEL